MKTNILKTILHIPKTIAIILIKVYKHFISPLFPNSCRFNPTCSQYTLEAIERYGFIIGTLLGVYRILRCNPFSKGGFDTVPDINFINKIKK